MQKFVLKYFRKKENNLIQKIKELLMTFKLLQNIKKIKKHKKNNFNNNLKRLNQKVKNGNNNHKHLEQ